MADSGLTDWKISVTQLMNLLSCLEKQVWCRAPESLNGGPRTNGSSSFDDPTYGIEDLSGKKSLMSRTRGTKRWTADPGLMIEIFWRCNSRICRPVLRKKNCWRGPEFLKIVDRELTNLNCLVTQLSDLQSCLEKIILTLGPNWVNGGPSTNGLKFSGDPTYGFADLSWKSEFEVTDRCKNGISFDSMAIDSKSSEAYFKPEKLMWSFFLGGGGYDTLIL